MAKAVLFPGIGYGCEKPLLYYGAKLAEDWGYEVVRLAWHDLPRGVKGDPAAMRRAIGMALEQAEEQLAGEELAGALFISKSIGTAVAREYDIRHGVGAKHLLYTPVGETFSLPGKIEAIAFHGMKDPWAETAAIKEACRREGIETVILPSLNHSLETGDMHADLDTLTWVMDRTERWLREKERERG